MFRARNTALETPWRDDVSLGARAVRALRPLRRLRGFERLAARLAPPGQAGNFVVRNPDGAFAGDMTSFIERRLYLFGGYEEESIALFRRFCADRPRRTMLDVGANVGTHSIALARDFGAVHAFDPNAALWPRFERNVALSGLANVALHKFGLADQAQDLPFYLPASANSGLGTLSEAERYDTPLKQAGTARIERGDDALAAVGIVGIDAVKIDVQGFEQEVLNGLRETLRTSRPVVWLEVGEGPFAGPRGADALRAQFPYSIALFRFACVSRFPAFRYALEPVTGAVLEQADYLIAPAPAP